VYEQQQDDTTPSIANAGFWARLLALVVDFLLVAVPVLVVVNVVLFPLETENLDPDPVPHETQIEDFAEYPLILGLLSAFFAFFWFWGRSPGMFLLGLRATAQRPERGSRWVSSAARGLLTALFIVSAFLLVGGGLADTSASWNPIDYLALGITATAVILGLMGYLALFLDKERRTLQDRVTGVRMVKARSESRSLP
jgi:hypothetical protein